MEIKSPGNFIVEMSTLFIRIRRLPASAGSNLTNGFHPRRSHCKGLYISSIPFIRQVSGPRSARLTLLRHPLPDYWSVICFNTGGRVDILSYFLNKYYKMNTAKKIGIVLTCSLALLVGSVKTFAQIGVDVSITARIAPPALVVYTQPPCPYDGYLWTPGYWAYGDDGYFWVPGVWVSPPEPGFLWTPCWWGYSGGIYGFHSGYWGPHVGFYGGVNYGYGYGGSGFYGGRWEGGSFRYNTAVVNVNRTVVHNTYIDRTVIRNTVVNNHTSFNGGPGGIAARPSAQEEVALREHHVAATSAQQSHQQTAGHDRNQFAAVNHGRPATTAMNTVGGSHFNPQGHVATVSSVHQNGANVHQNAAHLGNAPAAHTGNAPVSTGHSPGNTAHTPAQPSHDTRVAHTPVQQQQHFQPHNAQPEHNMQPQHNTQPQHMQPQQQHMQPQQQHMQPQQHQMQPHPQQQHMQPQPHPAAGGGGGHEAPHERHR
jgi:hypothetical protein